MKTTFTLSALFIVMAFSNLKAQIIEGFENTGGLAYYQANGWSFYGATFDYTSKVTAAGSIYVIPSTSNVNNNNSNSNTTQVVSPSIAFINGGKISFSYKLGSALGNNQDRNFVVRLWDAAGVSTTLGTITINGSTPVGTIQNSPAITVPSGTGSRRVIIDFTGKGDGNAFLYFDNLSILPNTIESGSTLPVKLLAFSGSINNEKALLNWKVDANETGAYFELQKSKNGKSFTTVKMIFANENAGVANYQAEDQFEESAYYRIYIVNKDQSKTYSNIIYLKEHNAAKAAQELQMLQNPIQNSLQFTFMSTGAEQHVITLYNALGHAVYTNTLTAQKGTNAMNLTMRSSLQKGTYVLEVRSAVNKQTILVSK